MSIRQISYREAIREALLLSMARDERVFLMGCGVTSPTRVFGSVEGILERFGSRRCLETPIAENAMAGVAIGAALAGMRPVLVHQRIDFALLAMDQLVNHAAKWHYMCGGTRGVAMTLRGIIGRRWGQGAQHSQSLQSIFAHIPGLKVVMPSNPYDAKGLLIASIEDDNPVVFLEHRMLYENVGPVPTGLYRVRLGKARVARKGKDVTIAAVSLMVQEAERAAAALKRAHGIDAEVIDLRSLRPLDENLLLESVGKTGRLVIADTGWKGFGLTAEIAAVVSEAAFLRLRSPIRRIALADAPCPTSMSLEEAYYPGAADIVHAVRQMLYPSRKPSLRPAAGEDTAYRWFKGPF